MDEDDLQEFCLRWHNHQTSVIGALGCMLDSGSLADVTLSANGTTLKAHRLVLASCSQYFAQLFKELESENGSLVVVLSCEAAELRLLLSFMYCGEVTAPRVVLPGLLRLAHALKVAGLTPYEVNNSTLTPSEADETPEIIDNITSPINLDIKNDTSNSTIDDLKDTKAIDNDLKLTTVDKDAVNNNNMAAKDIDNYTNTPIMADLMLRNEKERLSRLDQIVQNLYSSHRIVTSTSSVPNTPVSNVTEPLFPNSYRVSGSVCEVCHKRLSNQYNLRVHMETHAGVRHRCHACTHVSRSRDALRKHVAYRHPHTPHGTHTRHRH